MLLLSIVVAGAAGLLIALGMRLNGDVAAAPAGPSAPSAPSALICRNQSVLSGPSTAPAGAVSVPAGDNSSLFNGNTQPNTTYWFAPGTHYVGSDQFAQIDPADGDVFVGAPGAVIDGQKIAETAFGGSASNVTIKYLTIQNFNTPQDQGTINHDMGTGWTVTNITGTHNNAAAVMVGPNGVLKDSCLTQNGQYGFQGAAPQTDSNIVVDHNEISNNNTNNTEALSPDCGCSGGSKFWDVRGAVVTNNYVHDNMGAGLWADTNNTGFDIEGNYIAHNDGEGIEYEISYNALIKNNTFLDNGWVAGPKNPGFPTGAIYLSESGSDSRVPGNYGNTLEITGNVFTDNFSGVVAWENADRFCGSPANTSSDYCTLVNPSTVTTTSCNSTNIKNSPYIDDCRWKTQNVQVHDNVFNLTPSNIGSTCTVANTCGFQGVFSNWGSTPSWSPYLGPGVEDNISLHQNNKWYNNTYNGPWHFMPHDMSYDVNFATWQSTWGQDSGSTYNGTAPSPSPSATSTATSSPSPTATATATASPTASPTATSSPSPSPTATATSSPTPVTGPTTTSGCTVGIETSKTTNSSSTTATAIKVGSFSTTGTKDLLVAYVKTAGPASGGSQYVTQMTGGGLSWTRAGRANGQFGDSEVWTARATGPLSGITVTATRKVAGYHGSMTVVAFTNAGGIGSVVAAGAASGAAGATLPSTTPGSIVWGVGNDWDGALARTLPSADSMYKQWVDTADTFWLERVTATSTGGATYVGTTAPTNHQWNFVAAEVVPGC